MSTEVLLNVKTKKPTANTITSAEVANKISQCLFEMDLFNLDKKLKQIKGCCKQPTTSSDVKKITNKISQCLFEMNLFNVGKKLKQIKGYCQQLRK